jgi:3-phosphoshikimate 1-carboxyvinyltransferase
MVSQIPSQLRAQPALTLNGDVSVPGDKSITHRALMLGSIATGETRIKQALLGADCVATLKAFQQLGVAIDTSNPADISIQGVGMHGLKPSTQPLDLGNSGTAIRLMTGLLAGANIAVQLTGDASLCSRPMMRVVAPLRSMGAQIELTSDNLAPVFLKTHSELQGIEYEMPVASAQVKSALLLAGLYAQSATSLWEPAVTRDHTERMLQCFGASLIHDENRIHLKPTSALQGQEIVVPGDLSSAAFFIVAATIAATSHVTLRQVGMNPTRTGVIDILRQMGAQIGIHHERVLGMEPVADLLITPAPLRGIAIPSSLVPLAIDEFPIIFIAAAAATGVTTLQGAAELRVKESDRLQAMADGLTAVGIIAKTTETGIEITGGEIQGGLVNSHGDHRIAMAFAMASLRAREDIVIQQCENIGTSFPNFLDLCQQLGLSIKGDAL